MAFSTIFASPRCSTMRSACTSRLVSPSIWMCCPFSSASRPRSPTTSRARSSRLKVVLWSVIWPASALEIESRPSTISVSRVTSSNMLPMVSRYSSGVCCRCRPTSPTLRIDASGVLNSWDASAVKRFRLSKESLKPLQKIIENPCHVAQLVVGVLDRKPLVKLTGSDRFRAERHVLQWEQRLEGHAIAGEPGNQKRGRHRQQQQSKELQRTPCSIGAVL